VLQRPVELAQYTSLTFGQRCDEAGILPSTGRTGSCYDNAVTESFFASLETELIDRTAFPTRHHAEEALCQAPGFVESALAGFLE
jgi:putative transposase